MLDEKTRRRAEYRPGQAIRLADGQDWTFPAPPDPDGLDAGGPAASCDAFGPVYEALIHAVCDAEDWDDARRCELALALYLISHNYELDAPDYQALFGFEPGSAELARAQAAFHALAADHARRLRPQGRKAAEAEPVGWIRGLMRIGARLRAGRRPARAMELAGGPCR